MVGLTPMASARRSMLGRRGFVLLLLLVASMIGWVALRRWERGRAEHVVEAPYDPLVEVPAGVFLAVDLDLAALRAHPATRDWLREPRMVEGLGDVASLCGADPLDRVERLLFAVPSAADAGFGLVASGTIDPELFLGCAERLIARRGGKATRETRDGVIRLRDLATPDAAEIALRPGRGLLLAEPALLRQMLSTRDARGGSLATEPAHVELRQALGSGTLVATAVLSEDQRRTLADELEKQGVAASPFAKLRSVGLSVAGGDTLRVRAMLVADDTTSAAAMAELVRAELVTQAKSPLASLVGYGPLLGRFSTNVEQTLVRLEAELPVTDVLFVLRRVVSLKRLVGERSADSGAKPN